MLHLQEPNKFQFIHKILLVRFKRFLSKDKQQETVHLQILRLIIKLEFQI